MARSPFDALDALLETHRWVDAAAELARLEAGDGASDPRLLRGYRRLEEGRGSRQALAAHVSRFIARAPESRALPLVRIEKGIALLWGAMRVREQPPRTTWAFRTWHPSTRRGLDVRFAQPMIAPRASAFTTSCSRPN
jgi:hypothetical protein